jgi:hypothetical protein
VFLRRIARNEPHPKAKVIDSAQHTSMKMLKLMMGLVLAVGLFGFVGCKKASQEVAAGTPMEIEGVKVDLPKLLVALEGATPEQQSAARNMQMAFRYRQFEKALMEADKLANDATLNEQQKKIAGEVLEQVKQLMAKAPAAPAQ